METANRSSRSQYRASFYLRSPPENFKTLLTGTLSSWQCLVVDLGLTLRWYSTTFGMFGVLGTTEPAAVDARPEPSLPAPIRGAGVVDPPPPTTSDV